MATNAINVTATSVGLNLLERAQMITAGNN
jgi:hypothetical protein